MANSKETLDFIDTKNRLIYVYSAKLLNSTQLSLCLFDNALLII